MKRNLFSFESKSPKVLPTVNDHKKRDEFFFRKKTREYEMEMSKFVIINFSRPFYDTKGDK